MQANLIRVSTSLSKIFNTFDGGRWIIRLQVTLQFLNMLQPEIGVSHEKHRSFDVLIELLQRVRARQIDTLSCRRRIDLIAFDDRGCAVEIGLKLTSEESYTREER